MAASELGTIRFVAGVMFISLVIGLMCIDSFAHGNREGVKDRIFERHWLSEVTRRLYFVIGKRVRISRRFRFGDVGIARVSAGDLRGRTVGLEKS